MFNMELDEYRSSKPVSFIFELLYIVVPEKHQLKEIIVTALPVRANFGLPTYSNVNYILFSMLWIRIWKSEWKTIKFIFLDTFVLNYIFNINKYLMCK